jgi:DNA-binding protein HU-beta
MTKAFIAEVLRQSCELTPVGATAAAGDLIDTIVEQLKRDGKFVLPGFGKFTVVKTKAYIGLNPSTGEKIKVKAGKTVRFKVSPGLRRTITASRQRRSDSEPAPRSRRRDTREVSAEQLSAAAD